MSLNYDMLRWFSLLFFWLVSKEMHQQFPYGWIKFIKCLIGVIVRKTSANVSKKKDSTTATKHAFGGFSLLTIAVITD